MRTMLSAVSLFVLVAASPTVAQDTPSAAPSDLAPRTDAVPAASAPNDPHLAKALEFISVSGSRELAVQRIDLLTPLVLQMARQQVKPADEAIWKEIETDIQDELHQSVDGLVTDEARIYAAHFTDADFDDLIAFYKSDIGKKYLAERPKIVKESAAAGIAWGNKMAADLIKRVLEKVRHQHPEGKSL